MKSASEILDEFYERAAPPLGTVITICEKEPKTKDDSNWFAAVGVLTQDAKARYLSVLREMPTLYPIVDWSGIIQPEGRRRCISK
jgi:hypothetical protein